MDVELPDGTIIEGVPEGTTKEQLMAKLARRQQGAAIDKGKRELADSLSIPQAMLVGAGRGGDSLWGGLKQIGIGLTGAAGGAAGMALGRAIQPFRPAANAVRNAATEAAERFGLNLTPGEATGNRALKWAQAALDDLPFASGMGTARRAGNAEKLNEAA